MNKNNNPITEIKRMKYLANIKENLENDDVIYNNLLDTDHEMLISQMMEKAETTPSMTLIDFLKEYDFSDEQYGEYED